MGLHANTVVKTRRSHRKSRNGCTECKRRHIRCDERRPACTNCTIAERICSFPLTTQPRSPATDSSSFSPQSHSHSHTLSRSCEPEPGLAHSSPTSWPVCSPDPTTATITTTTTTTPTPTPTPTPPCLVSVSVTPDHYRAPAVAPAPTLPSFTESFINTNYDSDPSHCSPAPLGPLYTAQHLMILHHTFTSVARDAIVARDQMQGVVEIAIRDAIEAPYLIDQLLALSALHLAARIDSREPGKAGNPASLRHQATELQTRAVSSFTRLTSDLPPEDRATCVPRFLFASLLSLQVLAETLHQHRRYPDAENGRPTQFHDFIHRMVDCMRLHGSMLSLIRPTWNHLLQSELFPLLRISHNAANKADIKLSQGTECQPLEQLIKAPSEAASAGPPLDPASTAACLGCIDRLQWAFDMQNSLPEQDVPHAASGFIIMHPAEYADVLQTLRPEALIILAYFGVLLHRCRRFWAFENVGANMIHAIAGHLGPRWHAALAWPLTVIETEND